MELDLSLILPFLKANPFDDYTVVDTVTLDIQSSSYQTFGGTCRYTAYYRPSNTLVEITRHRVLRITHTFQRLKTIILALQFKFMQLFDFIIEDDLEQCEGTLASEFARPYLNIYLVRQAKENIDNKMISLDEFKLTFRDVMEVQQRVELLRRIVKKVSDFHDYCGGLPTGGLSLKTVMIDKEDGEIYFNWIPFEVTPSVCPDIDTNMMPYQGPEYLFNSPEYHALTENDTWSLGCILYELLSTHTEPLFAQQNLKDKFIRTLQLIGHPNSCVNDVPYCNESQFVQITQTQISPKIKQLQLVHSEYLNSQGNLIFRHMLSQILQWSPYRRIRIKEIDKYLIALGEQGKCQPNLSQTMNSTVKVNQSFLMKPQSSIKYPQYQYEDDLEDQENIVPLDTQQNLITMHTQLTKGSDDYDDFNFSLSQKLSSDLVSQAKLLNKHQTTNSRLSFLYSLQSSLERNHKSSQHSLHQNPSLRKLIVSSSAEAGLKQQGRVKLQSKIQNNQPQLSSGFQVSSSKDGDTITSNPQQKRTISGQFVLVSSSQTPYTTQPAQEQPFHQHTYPNFYSPFSLLQTQKLPEKNHLESNMEDSLDGGTNHMRSQYSDSLKKRNPYLTTTTQQRHNSELKQYSDSLESRQQMNHEQQQQLQYQMTTSTMVGGQILITDQGEKYATNTKYQE